MDLVFGDALTGNILVNGAAVILVVAQRVEYLREGQVWEADKNLFGCDAKLPQLCNGPHRCTGTRHNRRAMEDVVGRDDIRMTRCCRHGPSLLEALKDVNLLQFDGRAV